MSQVAKWAQAFALGRMAGGYEHRLARYKRRWMSGLSGDVCEIGPGAGANLPYYLHGTRLVAFEPNPFMWPYLRRRAKRYGVELDLRADPTGLATVPDCSMDAVVCTLVLCMVDDPAALVAEALRVLRPGGRYVFVEHVAAPPGSRARAVQDRIEPLWRALADGCRPNRETWRVLESAGFAKIEMERFAVPAPVFGPHIAGCAWKASVRER